MNDPHPFLRWAGGKREHARHHAHLLPSPVGATGYQERFLGGGALFFELFRDVRPAVLSDLNPRLIAAYLAVRDRVEELIEVLSKYPYDEQFYYSIRDKMNETPYAPLVQRAAWMIYLNRTCVNGLYRENKSGDFNVGFGKTSSGKAPPICDADNLRACSAALQCVDLRCGDFEKLSDSVNPGEVWILDPPYLPESETANFVGYTKAGFSRTVKTTQVAWLPTPVSDQDRLAAMLKRLDQAGVDWALTNAATDESLELYKGWHITEVKIQRSISLMGKADDEGAREGKRERVGEIIVRNRPSSRVDG